MISATGMASLQRACRIAAWAIGILLCVAVVMGIWVGVRGALAYQHLARIQAEAPGAASAWAKSPAEATSILEDLAAEAHAADDLTSDFIWSVSEETPWIGPQLAAFRAIASSSDQLLGGGLLPLATAAGGLSVDALQPHNGRLDVSALGRLAASAGSAATAAQSAAAAVRDIDRRPLLGVVESTVDQADEVFSRSAVAIDALSRSTQLLPSMLGQETPRTYLLLVQNNAEWRSLGGISGTAILLRTDQGAISLADTRSATALSRGLSGPIVDLPAQLQQIYETRPARYFHNLTQIPDFAVDGPLAREMYLKQTGEAVDGVVAIDPVTLSYLLEATGPVALSDGESLTSDNAVPLLLNEVYERYTDPYAQDAFFAQATSAILQAFLEGRGSTTGLLAALGRAVDERRLLIWSANDADQRLIDGTTLAGRLPETDDKVVRFGVYLNDGTGSKMSYYVEPTVKVEWDSCESSSRELSLTLSLRSNAPLDAASSLPTYVTGNGAYGTPPGDAAVVSNIYVPTGWTVVSVTNSNGSGYQEAMYDGRQVLTFGSTLAPAQSDTVSVTVSSSSTPSEAEALVTPTADSSLSPTVHSKCVPVSSATLR